MMAELTQLQKNLLTLELVKACNEYSEDTHKTFEEILKEDIFPNTPYTEYQEMVCKTLETLNKQGYIDGNVALAYEIELDPDTLEESNTDAIDIDSCTFEDIKVSTKGKAYTNMRNFKEAGKNMYTTIKPLIKSIASATLQTLVEATILSSLKSAGVVV